MSAEARRRMGTDLAPLDFAWQAWHFQRLSLDLRGRRGTFGTSIDVSGSSATNGGRFGAAGSCVAGMTLFSTSASICVAGVVLSAHSIDVRGSFATICVAGVVLLAPP